MSVIHVLLNLQLLAFFIYISHHFDNLLYIPSIKKNVFQCQSVYLYVVFLTVCFVLILIVSPWSFFIPIFFKFCIRGDKEGVVWDCRCGKFFK